MIMSKIMITYFQLLYKHKLIVGVVYVHWFRKEYFHCLSIGVSKAKKKILINAPVETSNLDTHFSIMRRLKFGKMYKYASIRKMRNQTETEIPTPKTEVGKLIDN